MKPALFFKKIPHRTTRLSLLVALIFFCMSISILLFGIAALSMQVKQIITIYQIQRKIGSAQKHAKQNGPDQIKILESEKAALHKTHQKLIRRLEQKNPFIVQLYFSIQSSLPSTCIITEAKVSKKELSLNIQAPTKDILLKYHTMLAKMPQFRSVKLSSLEQVGSIAQATIKIIVS